MTAGPAWDDEDEPTVIRPPQPQMPAPGVVDRLNRHGTLWGVAGVLPPLAFLCFVALARQAGIWGGAEPAPEWAFHLLVAGAVAAPVAGFVGGWLALRNGLTVHRSLTAAGVKHHMPAGMSLGWSALLFGVAGLVVALWMLGRAAASLR